MTHPILKIYPELLKTETKDEKNKELKYKKEKHDLENILNSIRIGNDYYRKNIKV